MSDENSLTKGDIPRSIAIHEARRIATTTKGQPTLLSKSPRWFCALVPWVGVTAGTYRVNKARVHVPEGDTQMLAGHRGEPMLPATFVNYESAPVERSLNLVQSIVRINVGIAEMFCQPMDQLAQQLRIAVLEMKERKEAELINNAEFGLCGQVVPSMRVATRTGPPTPDDMDELIARVWKKPAFFLAHPRAIAAFGRECTLRGVPPATVQIMGCPFLTWRGLPLVPCDKLPVYNNNKSDILLMRVGEEEQGVIALRDASLQNEHGHSVSVNHMGITDRGTSSYLISLYFSLAVLSDDAVGMLEGVDLGVYHDRKS